MSGASRDTFRSSSSTSSAGSSSSLLLRCRRDLRGSRALRDGLATLRNARPGARLRRTPHPTSRPRKHRPPRVPGCCCRQPTARISDAGTPETRDRHRQPVSVRSAISAISSLSLRAWSVMHQSAVCAAKPLISRSWRAARTRRLRIDQARHYVQHHAERRLVEILGAVGRHADAHGARTRSVISRAKFGAKVVEDFLRVGRIVVSDVEQAKRGRMRIVG